ncbi:MAG: hypothetical protein QGF46_01175 [Planctomycetota bacterium]|nr:hypothetical protein [Planctomycetota bacterium]
MVKPVNQTDWPTPQELVKNLKIGASKSQVLLVFKDGRRELGAITFFESQEKGRLIDVDREYALDFTLSELETIEY